MPSGSFSFLSCAAIVILKPSREGGRMAAKFPRLVTPNFQSIFSSFHFSVPFSKPFEKPSEMEERKTSDKQTLLAFQPMFSCFHTRIICEVNVLLRLRRSLLRGREGGREGEERRKLPVLVSPLTCLPSVLLFPFLCCLRI